MFIILVASLFLFIASRNAFGSLSANLVPHTTPLPFDNSSLQILILFLSRILFKTLTVPICLNLSLPSGEDKSIPAIRRASVCFSGPHFGKSEPACSIISFPAVL